MSYEAAFERLRDEYTKVRETDPEWQRLSAAFKEARRVRESA